MTTNYERYFGTPEKAANTLARIESKCTERNPCLEYSCLGCPIQDACDGRNATLLWLEEAE